MSRHSEPHKRSRVFETLLAAVIGIVLAAVGLFYLVRSGLEFGDLAIAGQAPAWIFASVAGIGGFACVGLIVVLVVRCLRMLEFVREYKPRRASSRHSK